MRIEKLNKDKIKVTLTTAELINLDIDVKRLSPDSKELQTFLFHIMETIREETGFNPYNGQVVVEATPSQDGISILVKRLNKGIKKITEEQFKKVVSVKPKKKELKERAARLREELSKAQEATANAEKFMNVVRRHTTIEELTPTLLREFVEKIVVHESVALDGKRRGKLRRQEIEIYYSFVGKVELPDT